MLVMNSRVYVQKDRLADYQIFSSYDDENCDDDGGDDCAC